MEEYCISVIGKDHCGPQSKGGAGNLLSHNLPVTVLQTNLSDFVEKVGCALEGIHSKISNYDLDEIEMNIEVSASGGISLVGAIEAGVVGGITLRFKRCQHE